MTTTTAALVLACAWVGALVGAAIPLVAPIGLVAGVAAVAGAALAAIGRRGRPLLVAVVLAVAATAALGASVRTVAVAEGVLARAVDERVTATGGGLAVSVDLTAVDDPRTTRTGGRWVLARLSAVEVPADARTPTPSTRCAAAPEQGPGCTSAASAPRRTRERVVLRLPADVRAPFDAHLRVRGLATPIEGAAAGWFEGLGAVVQIDPVRTEPIADPPGWRAATTWLRVRTGAAAGTHLGRAPAALLAGLVTGDVEDLPEATADQVRDAGLSHLVAVSGSNVALVVAGVLGFAGLVGVGRRGGWWLALGAVWWFAVLVRVEPSVVRASAMATLVLAALLVGRVRSTGHLLCTAGAVVLLVDPMLARRLGFVLSMSATAGVVLIAPALAARRPTWLPRPVAALASATVAAQVAVAPVLLVGGDGVHAASIPANVLAVPAAGAASLVGAVAAVVAVIDVEAAGVVAAVARPALWLVLASARWFADPAVRQAVEVIGALAAAGLLAILAWRRLPHRVRVVGPVVVAVVAAMLVGRGPTSTGAPASPVLIALDVGQGDAILLGDPSGGWVLVDGGPDPAAAADRLADRGITRLAAVVASHSDADHVTGLPAVLRAVDVGTVIIGPRGEAAADLLAAARSAGTRVTTVAAGGSWQHGTTAIRVLSPPQTGLGEDPNDNSLVLRVDVPGGRSALLTGDAEVVPQSLLIDDPLVDVDVLKVPHHGGATNAQGFLAATTPEVAVISVGADNDFGHPHPDVLADLAGIDLRRTDEDGDVVIILRP